MLLGSRQRAGDCTSLPVHSLATPQHFADQQPGSPDIVQHAGKVAAAVRQWRRCCALLVSS